MYTRKCSPDCPFDDCVLVYDFDPSQLQFEGENNDQSTSDKSDAKSDDSVSRDKPGSSEQDQQTSEGESSESQQGSQGASGSDGGSSEGLRGSERSSSGSDKGSSSKHNDKKQESDESKKDNESKPREQEKPRVEPKPEYKPVFDKHVKLMEALKKEPGGYGAVHKDEAIAERKGTAKKLENMTDHAFQARLKSVMTDNAYDRRVRGRKRGRLDMRSLYKVPAKSENIFTLKEARKNKKYNIVLLVDESGSMAGSRAKKAADSAVFLAKAFDGINVDVAIIGFNENITVRKVFGVAAEYDKIHEAIRTCNYGNGSGCNNDWDGLNRAYDMLGKIHEGKNILIMLSDGQPASGYPRFIGIDNKEEKPPKGTDEFHGNKDSIENIRHLVKAHDRDVVSLGIGIERGGQQIPNHEVINNVNQLKPTMIKMLKEQIKRG